MNSFALEESLNLKMVACPSTSAIQERLSTTVSILLVEDSALQARLVKDALSSGGLPCHVCTSGRAALEWLKTNTPELMIVDHELGDMTAKDLIFKLHELSITLPPFLSTTGRGDEQLAVEMLKLGARDYLVKNSELLGKLPGIVSQHLCQLQAESIIHEVEGTVKKLEQRNLRIIDSSPQAYVSFQNTGEIVDWNRSAEELFGWRRDEIRFHDFIDSVVAQSLRSQARQLLNEYLQRDDAEEIHERIETLAVDRAGREFPVSVSISSLKIDDLWSFHVFGQDISRRKEIETQLFQSEKLASIGQLAAGIAHEINNPIGFVSSNLNTLGEYFRDLRELIDNYSEFETFLTQSEDRNHTDLMSRLDDISKIKARIDIDYLLEDLQELMAESRDGLKRVTDIVVNLKSFARLDEASVKTVDLHEGIESTLKVVGNELKFKCDIVREYGQLPLLSCYPGQLNQVFMNLLVNASHAIEERGTITIKTEHKDGFIIVHIIDTGKGIAPEHIKSLFTPFFTTKSVGSGTGLGLSISYGIIKKHGGEIRVDSKLGSGSTFSIYLPDLGVPDES